MNKILKAIKTSIPFLDFKGRKRGEGIRALRLRIIFSFENAAARLAANSHYAERRRKLETLRQKQPTAIQDNRISFMPYEYIRLLLILADVRVAEERTRWLHYNKLLNKSTKCQRLKMLSICLSQWEKLFLRVSWKK